MEKEARARIKINKLLEDAGWRFFDTEDKRANIQLETNAKLEELGEDFENTKDGYVDYVLLDDDSHPICVLEAKSEDKDPLSAAKEQARKYANSLGVRFIILSNGNLHYFWDKELGNPTSISHFPTLESLTQNKTFEPDQNRLAEEDVQEDYVALTQNPTFKDDPRWNSEQERDQFIKDSGLRLLRPYQLQALKSLQNAVSEGKNRFLFEMATGTGKTLVSAAIIKLYLKTKNARRILFLVDRIELENQTKKAFDDYLKNDYRTAVYKQNRDDWRKAEIVVTTIQSIQHNNKYLKVFAPNDFDLVISDEAHRSISGNSRTVFEYFIGHKLGLTATPKDYLKNISDADELDPRELERRTLLSTYKVFGCESGEPTFRYSLIDGAEDGYLVTPRAIDCRTEVTTQLLSDEGYAVQVEDENGNEEEVIYKQSNFERNFFSDKTNAEFAKTVMENAMRDPISNEIGKTIVFAVSRKHATKLTQLFNEYAHEMFPGKYNSDFAVQITSDVEGAQQMTTNFANNNLNGHTNFLPGYKSSKTRVCVTVGMMTTGYDCEDLLNLALMRPIFSPTDFVQIKGRGTRKFYFKHTDGQNTLRKDKDTFKLFDFFANIEYFEEKYPYDEVIKLPPTSKNTGGDGPPKPPVEVDSTSINIPDPLQTIEVVSFEGDVMRVDRELYKNKFEETVKEAVKTSPEFQEAVETGNYSEMEQYIQEHIMNKPQEYFTMQRVREAYQADRRLGLWEILDKIFGRIRNFKTKDELAEEAFERFSVTYDIPSELYYEIREFFKRYLTDEEFRATINQRNYNELAGDPVLIDVLQKLGRDRLTEIPEYIKDNVPLNQFV